MALIDFIKEFIEEESCKQKFKEYREHVGVSCRKCGGTDYYWKSDKEQYECKKCRTRTTMRSGTILQGSKLPYQYWFITMHLLPAKHQMLHSEYYKKLKKSRCMKNIIMLFVIFIILGSCKAQEKENYKLITEHRYEISLINETLVYSNLMTFVDSCDNTQHNKGGLNILFIINNKGKILSVRINKNMNLHIKDEIELLNYLQSEVKIKLSDNALKYYQLLNQDSILFYYNFSKKRIVKKR